MRPFLALVALALALALASTTVASQQFYAAGEGTVTCGKYLEHRRENEDTQNYIYVTWVNGFLTASNRLSSTKKRRIIPDGITLLAYLDKYCRENPLKVIILGVIELDKEL